MAGRIKARLTILAGALMLAAILATPGSASATGFGRDGKELLRVGGAVERALSYPGNRVLLVGDFHGLGDGLLRLRANGSIDRSFGGDGRVPLSFGEATPSRSGLNDVFVQPDGRILAISSRSREAKSDFAVERLLPNGRLDRSFGVKGLAVVDLGQPFESGTAVAALPDGHIIVGGYSEKEVVRGLPGTPVLARLHASGALDTGFGSDGVLKAPAYVEPADLLPHGSGGRFVVAGGDYGELTMAQIYADGKLDRSFGKGGALKAPPPRLGGETFFEPVKEIGQARDGSLFVAGTFSRGAAESVIAIRYTARGRLDRRYGSGGIAKVPFGGSPFIEGFAVRPNGKAVLAGQILQPKKDSDFLAVGLDPSGRLDPRLGRHGIAKLEMGGWDMGYGVASIRGGAVLVGGVQGHHVTALARLLFHPVR